MLDMNLHVCMANFAAIVRMYIRLIIFTLHLLEGGNDDVL